MTPAEPKLSLLTACPSEDKKWAFLGKCQVASCFHDFYWQNSVKTTINSNVHIFWLKTFWFECVFNRNCLVSWKKVKQGNIPVGCIPLACQLNCKGFGGLHSVWNDIVDFSVWVTDQLVFLLRNSVVLKAFSVPLKGCKYWHLVVFRTRGTFCTIECLH